VFSGEFRPKFESAENLLQHRMGVFQQNRPISVIQG
jgi:hypothetical protein